MTKVTDNRSRKCLQSIGASYKDVVNERPSKHFSATSSPSPIQERLGRFWQWAANSPIHYSLSSNFFLCLTLFFGKDATKRA